MRLPSTAARRSWVAPVQAGESVLVLGATGSVGSIVRTTPFSRITRGTVDVARN